jgi:probable HAF family extracellular repeat protein
MRTHLIALAAAALLVACDEPNAPTRPVVAGSSRAASVVELGILGGTWSRAHAINESGAVVGASCTQDCLSTAFYWTEAGGQQDLGGLAGYTRSAAFAITSRGEVFGWAECRGEDAGCGGVYATQLVRWDRVGETWTITPVEGCSVVSLVSDASKKFPINNNDQCVHRTSAGVLSIQRLSGGVAVDEALLPSLRTGGSSYAYGISDAPMVAGTSTGEIQFQVPVAWYRDATGTWAVIPLAFPGTDNFGRANDISEPDGAGRVRVVGWTEDAYATRSARATHAVRWTLEPDAAGGWRLVSTQVLPIPSKRSTNAWAAAVNPWGDVVGISGPYVDSSDPVKWAVGGGVETLPNSTGGSRGRAVDINSQGWIVGAVWDSKNNCDRAAIWRPQ